MSLKNENLIYLFYKDGSQVQYATHLHDSDWHRGCVHVAKSRKMYRCAVGCELPPGSRYSSLSMMAGYGRLDSCVDFALCGLHLHETEELLGTVISDADTDSIFTCWLKLIR